MIALDTSAECTEQKQYRDGSVMLGATSVGVDVVGNKAGGGPAASSQQPGAGAGSVTSRCTAAATPLLPSIMGPEHC